MKQLIFFVFILSAFNLSAEINFPDGEQFNWQDAKVQSLHPGISYVKFTLKSPRLMQIAAVRVDLKTSGLRFKMTPKADRWGEAMPGFPDLTIRTRRLTCRKFMEDAVAQGENMLVAINGSAGWRPWTAPWNHPYADRVGLLVADGVKIADSHGKNPSFIVTRDGNFKFDIIPPGGDTGNILHAISGFAFVLKDGKLTIDLPKNNSSTKLAPRTGFGLSADRRYLYLMVVDGRQPFYSMGMTTREVGIILHHLGANDGLNMDGGGSTTLLIRKSGNITKLNHYIRNQERSVAASMGIIISAAVSRRQTLVKSSESDSVENISSLLRPPSI